MLITFLYALLISILIPTSQPTHIAVPIITTEPPLLQSGLIDAYKFNPSITPSPQWSDSFTRSFARIKLTGTQTCSVILGIGGFDLEFGQHESEAAEIKSQASFVSGTLTVLITMSNRNNFTSFRVTYLAISSVLSDFYVKQQQFTVGHELSSPEHQQKTYSDLPPIGSFTEYRVYISIFSMQLAYDHGGKNGMQLIIETVFTAPNEFNYTLSSSQFSWNPFIEVIKFYALITPMDSVNNMQRANIILQQQINTQSLAGVDQQKLQDFPYVKTTTNFVSMLYGFRSVSHLGQFNFIIETDAKLYYRASSTLAQIWAQVFLLYSQTCPDNFYYSENGRQCEKCAQYCSICNPMGTCDQCLYQFDPSTISGECSCHYQVISNLCYDFDNSPMKQCATAFNQSNIVQCIFCKASLYHTLINNQCVCRPQFQLNPVSQVCQQNCGDGLIYDHQCDDGNSVSGDGCSQKCKFEQNFECVRTAFKGPSYCWSLIEISFRVISIMKNRDNSAIIELMAVGFPLPFGLNFDQFEHSSFSIILKSNSSPSTTALNPTLLSVNGNVIVLKIDYDFTIEFSDCEIQVDMSKSRYPTYNPKINFVMSGDNFPLVFNSYINIFQTTSLLMLIVSIMVLVLMIVGAISNKLIGVEAIATMQLIYYSQILITSNSKFPIGFVAFRYLKYVNGYNSVLQMTSYHTKKNWQLKFNYLELEKTLLQNYNINFGLLLIAFLVFIVSCLFRQRQEKILLTTQDAELDPNQLKENHQKLKFWLRFSFKAYNIIYQISLWSILQFLAGCAAQLMISNSQTFLQSSKENAELFLDLNRHACMITISIIILIGLNSFRNIFLSQMTVGKLKQKRMEVSYKRAIFVYLLVMGSVIMFGNELVMMKTVPASVMALLIHLIYVGVLIYINPYKMSLRIHTVGLFACQSIYGIFLIFINTINYLPSIPEVIVLSIVYTVIVCSFLIIILSVIRLYYEYKFGKTLEKEVQKQRLLKEQKRIEIQKARLKKIMKSTSEKSKINVANDSQNMQALTKMLETKNQNPYLIQNQLQNDKKYDILNWLQSRQIWTKQQKQEYYFRKYKMKPLNSIKQNEPQKYQNLMNKKAEQLIKQKERNQIKKNDPEYQALIKRLKKELTLNKETL